MSVVEPSVAARRAKAGAVASTARVTVIVLNWNGERDTTACLESCLRQRGVETDLLLVDNASADGSGERLRDRFPMVEYLQTGANLGYAGGNNCGIGWALGRGAEWVLVVNNDTVLDPDCIRLLLAAAVAEPRLAAVATLIVRHDDTTRIWFAGGRFDRVRAIGAHQGEGARIEGMTPMPPDGAVPAWEACTFLTGCCLLLRASALRDVGLFRADFFAYGEDLDLSLRLSRSDWEIGWVPSARLAHRVPPPDAEPTPNQIFLRDRNRRRLVRLHYSAPWRLAFALWFGPTRLIHLGRYLLRGDRDRARAIVRGLRAR